MVNQDFRINDGSDKGLSRGFFIENSEVGAGAFAVTAFLFRHVCGNHIVWDAQSVKEIRIRHVGKAHDKAFNELTMQIVDYVNSSSSKTEALIKQSKTFNIGASKVEVLETVFDKLRGNISRHILDKAYEKAIEEEHINQAPPNTIWGMLQGITSIAKDNEYGDSRVRIERSAGKLMSLVN